MLLLLLLPCLDCCLLLSPGPALLNASMLGPFNRVLLVQNIEDIDAILKAVRRYRYILLLAVQAAHQCGSEQTLYCSGTERMQRGSVQHTLAHVLAASMYSTAMGA